MDKFQRLFRSKILILVFFSISRAIAQGNDTGTQELAKTAQNPVADIVTLPLQNNIAFGLGPNDRVQYVLNIQPVYPINMTPNINLITRWILPIIYQPDIPSDEGGEFGLGDLNPSFFFSPVSDEELVWGVGVTLTIPTATDAKLGTGKWSIGPTGVIVLSMQQWLLGLLINNIWSYAGNDDRADVNQFLVQPFINYNIPNGSGLYLTSSPIITANWEGKKGNKWTVPLGAGIGWLLKTAWVPVNISAAAFGFVEKPQGGPEWLLRLQIQFLFPR